MKIQFIQNAMRIVAAVGCLSLLIGLQAFAEPQVQQPSSIAADSQTSEADVEQDAEVTPAGCTDSCCSGGCQEGCCGNGKCCGGGSCCCEAVCCPKRVTEEVKKHCWLVKPELVCIPGFRFECHWRRDKCCNSGKCCDTCTGGGNCCCGNGSCCDCAPPKCGRVRCINVLEKHEYKCEECGYEWEAKCVRSSKGCCRSKNGCCCPSCGCQGGCCADAETPASDVQLTSAEEAAATEAPAKKSLGNRWTEWMRR